MHASDVPLAAIMRLPLRGTMRIPTEPIGSIPRPQALIDAIAEIGDGTAACARASLRRGNPEHDPQLRSHGLTGHHRWRATEVPQLLDLQREGLPNTAPDGFRIPFAAGHVRRMPRLTRGPFKYRRYADAYLEEALRHATVPVKQAVISPSALSLMYPEKESPTILESSSSKT